VITIFGMNLAAMAAGARARFRSVNLGFVLQRSHLLPALSVIENVAVPLTILGLSKRRAHSRALEALTCVGLENLCRRDPAGLSVGERQRVAVARALVHRPGQILCDEPTAALDAATGSDVVRLLRARADDAGATVVLVTHDVALAQPGDRVWRMAGGSMALEPAPSVQPRA
jgi:putative ABC transport system ATP-binding protein